MISYEYLAQQGYEAYRKNALAVFAKMNLEDQHIPTWENARQIERDGFIAAAQQIVAAAAVAH